MSRQTLLLELQHLDDRLDHIRSEMAATERGLLGDPELVRLQARAHEAEAERVAAEDAVATLEREATAMRRRATLVERRMFDGSVRNPVDLLTMQHEFEALRAQLTAIEEREFARMEAAETAATAAGETEAAVVALEAQRSASAGPERAHLASLQRELAEIQAERAVCAGQVDAADLVLYARLASRVRPAVVPLQADTCGGCHLPMSHAEARSARTAERPVQCANCDRILVA